MRLATVRTAVGLVAGAAAAWPRTAIGQVADEIVGSGVVTLGAWDWINLVLRLVAVLAIIWGAFWAMRWYNRRIQVGYGSARALHVIETRALGPNRSIQLVRVGRRAVLVGVTPERINQLLEIDDPEEVERLAAAVAAERPSGPGFDRLTGMLSRITMPNLRSSRPAAPAWRESSLPVGQFDTPGPSAQQLQASTAYRNARIAELQRAIEDARRGTILEDAR